MHAFQFIQQIIDENPKASACAHVFMAYTRDALNTSATLVANGQKGLVKTRILTFNEVYDGLQGIASEWPASARQEILKEAMDIADFIHGLQLR